MSKTSLIVAVLLCCLAVALPPAAVAEEPKVEWDHKPGKELSLAADGQTLLTYHFASDAGFPWIHPVRTPGGDVLTEFAPGDHAWHRAVWFSWKILNGVNYWDWAGRKSGKPAGTTQCVGKEEFRAGKDSGTIAVALQYSAAEKPVLTERRQITIGLPRPDGSYAMDWKMTFTAGGEDVVFERTPPPPKGKAWGGYGGLSFRGVKGMSQIRVIDSEGREAKQGHGRAARWMDFSGAVRPGGKIGGVAIFDHPDNPRHPTPWYVSPAGGMAYFGPAFIFVEPYKLSAGKSFTLSYRMLIHPGRRDAAELDKEFGEFAKLKKQD